MTAPEPEEKLKMISLSDEMLLSTSHIISLTRGVVLSGKKKEKIYLLLIGRELQSQFK